MHFGSWEVLEVDLEGSRGTVWTQDESLIIRCSG